MLPELKKNLSLISTYLDEVNRVYPSISRLKKMMECDIPCDRILFVGSARSVNYMNEMCVILKFKLIPYLDKAKMSDYDYPGQYDKIQTDMIKEKEMLDALFGMIMWIRKGFSKFGAESDSGDIPIYAIKGYLKKIGCE